MAARLDARAAAPLLRAAHWLAAKPRVYDAIQRWAGLETIRRHLAPRLVEVAGKTVLDVGAGTGLYASCFPESARQVWLDNDPQKLNGFLRRAVHDRRALLSDAVSLGLRDRSVDYATCTNVTHHLDDAQLHRFVAEMARVVREGLILHDAVSTDRWVSRILWRCDRGSYPRSGEGLMAALDAEFEIRDVERYRALHEYLLVVALPRR